MALLIMQQQLLSTVEAFLGRYPDLSIVPYAELGLCLRGNFHFKVSLTDGQEIEDNYLLEIIVPEGFPFALPEVKGIDGRITQETANGHLFPDGSFCLGSPLRLLKLLHANPTLVGFADKCIVPYLCAVSYKNSNGGEFIFGELDHGTPGILKDYTEMLGVSDPEQVIRALELLGMRKRVGNKKECPCGCGRRLGGCDYRIKLNEFRGLAPASWFKAQANSLKSRT